MLRIKVGKEFEKNKDQIKNNKKKILRIFITMIVSKIYNNQIQLGNSNIKSKFISGAIHFSRETIYFLDIIIITNLGIFMHENQIL